LRHFELILSLEAELGVRFPGDMIPTMTSVAAIEEALSPFQR
jgi:acyl carrier protein